MHTTTLSTKGQVIIPKALRTALSWAPGTPLEVHETPDGLLLRPAATAQKTALRDGLAAIRRRIAYTGPVITLEEMNAEVLRQTSSSAAPSTSVPQSDS